MDKNWRPANWNAIKRNIVEQTPVIFSPATGYAKGQTEQIMEKVASSILESALKELPNVKSGIGMDIKSI